MGTEVYSKVFQTILSQDEWSRVPQDIGQKLEAFVEEKFDEFITSKALYESRRNEYESTLEKINAELLDYKSKFEDGERNYDSARHTINELESQVSTCTTELSKLQETCKRLEDTNAEFRRQRDSISDERDNLLQMLDRRNKEIERLQSDVATITAQLNCAINAKCEALAKFEEVGSMKVTLEYKEKHMEQEKQFLNQQIQNLMEDLNRQASEQQQLRRDHTSQLVLLESKLTKKSEELNIANENIAFLTSNNKALTQRAEELNEKLKKQREAEDRLQESFNNELQAQTRLADLYKGLVDENSAQIDELKKGVTELQNLLRSASDQYGELETKYREAEIEHDEILSKKNECIVLLKKELDAANEQLKQAREDSLHREIENLSPHAAAASKLLKSGQSITQIYSQYSNIYEELLAEKDENRKLNAYIAKILQEFEAKTPILQKERLEFEQAIETINELTKQNESLLDELQRIKDECNEAKKIESRVYRENEKMKKEIVDLSRQVCFLLKEIESSRTVSTPSPDRDVSISDSLGSSAEIISKKLVTFSDIQELQDNNKKLLALVRDLTSKQEEAECVDAAGIVHLKEQVNSMREKQTELLEDLERQSKRLQSLIKQRDMYKDMYQKAAKISTFDEEMQVEQTEANGDVKVDQTVVKDKKVKELEDKIAALNKEIADLKEEYETYRKEKLENDKIFLEQIEQLRKENKDLIQNNSKLTQVVEFNEGQFKIFKSNMDVYKNQISVLEETNKTYSNTIAKHETSLMHFKDETLNAQSKLSRVEIALQNAQQEIHLLRNSEARLLRERESLKRESQSQSILLNNLEMIKASIERSEAEGKLRMESRLDDSLRECAALRRRLQEEQDKFRELTTHLERQTKSAQQKMNNEIKEADRLRGEMNALRDELTKKSAQVEELTKKLKNSMLLSGVTRDDQKLKEMELQIKNYEEELKNVKQQLAIAKESNQQYCNIAENAEKLLKEEMEKNTQFKELTDVKMKEDGELIAKLRDKCGELEAELSLQSNGQQETTMGLRSQLEKTKQKLEVMSEEYEAVKQMLETVRNENRQLSETVAIAEDKYTREMMLHSTDLKALTTLREDCARLTTELNEVRHEKDEAFQTLNISKAGWEEREKMLNAEKKEIETRLSDLEAQNKVLHDQIQALSTQLSVVHAQHGETSFNTSIAESSLNRSLTEDDVKSSEQLLKIIKFLRREKDLAITKFEVLQAENTRLKSQQELIEKQLQENQRLLQAERENNEVSVVTAAKHAEVLRKVETLNAITDSNKILRDERDKLKVQVNELAARASTLEEQLVPLQEKNRELSAKAEAALTENVALRQDSTRWRQRATLLIEKANKVSHEDWRRVQTERDNLAKLLNSEKDAHKRLNEEANILRQDKNRLEEACNNLTNQNRSRMTEIKKLQDENNNIKQQLSRLGQELQEQKEIAQQRSDENTKITEDLASKDVQITDMKAKETQVRKIAKKYKTQYEELMKTVEEEKKLNEEREKNPQEVPADTQEQYRNEGRAEAENRLSELEKVHNEKINTLNEQIAAIQQEVETLKQENNVLKTNEVEKDDRMKTVLKSAKSRITDLTEERNRLRKELNDIRARLDNLDKGNERIIKLEKEKADLLTEKQQEKERLQREIETLTQRVNQLQRQLGLPPASKPSTSSGSSDKTGSEPPTANIKPMSGHSNIPTQQSATVMPWRGSETPFASIRPMSQLRTVAVLPTSQNAGNSSQSTPVLVPPQQQLVHTTGNNSIEVMSSSPTSSHTEYMPATSSASPAVAPIRQVVVPPTQQATIGMSTREEPPSAAESTQDMDAETETSTQQTTSTSTQQPQQAVAMVLPRVEQQSSTQQNVEQSSSVPVVASSQQASSSNTVTTTQATAGHKRPRETEGDSSTGGQENEPGKVQPQLKRTRTQGQAQEVFQGVTESGVEVEYQVPTSSQRDQEDDVIILSEDENEENEGPDEGECPDEGEGMEGQNEDPDEGGQFEESGDGDGESYEMVYEPEQELTYDDADCQDMDSSEAPNDDPNNEVEIIEDSCGEVPNQSGSSSAIPADASNVASQSVVGRSTESEGGSNQVGAPQSEAISSGSEGTSGVTLSQAASSFPRNRSIAPLSRSTQQSHLLLPHGFEETGDDGIVPSTPTLYVPRRTDGFGEAVSSPHVPSGRFTFNESTTAQSRLSVGQSEGDDSSHLTQLDDSGTGRSVPSTPLQVSPQGEQIGGESHAEVAPSVDAQMSESSQAQITEIASIPVITVGDGDTGDAEETGESPPSQPGPSGDGHQGETSEATEEAEDLLEEEGTDGVSSEGEKQQAVEEEIEEGREAEASESPSSNTRSRSIRSGTGTARRSSRASFRNRASSRPTPIVWSEQQQNRQQASPGARGAASSENRGNFSMRGHRARRMRQIRSPYSRF